MLPIHIDQSYFRVVVFEITSVLSKMNPGVTFSTVVTVSGDDKKPPGLSSTVVRIVSPVLSLRVSVTFVLIFLFRVFVLLFWGESFGEILGER